jgi:WD and tetratricopeptide repeat-containing protein 1
MFTPRLLASGSDDCYIILWDAFRKKRVLRFHTGHHGNVFSVKFLPHSFDRTLATCAADSRVRVHDLEKEVNILSCSCHMSRVKRLAVAPDTPYMVWSAAEDGYIL